MDKSKEYIEKDRVMHMLQNTIDILKKTQETRDEVFKVLVRQNLADLSAHRDYEQDLSYAILTLDAILGAVERLPTYEHKVCEEGGTNE